MFRRDQNSSLARIEMFNGKPTSSLVFELQRFVDVQ